MAENREEILANFQGITAIDDVAEAIFHLEETNWDLLMAINRVMPQDNVSLNANRIHQSHIIDDDSNDVEMIDQSVISETPRLNDIIDNDISIVMPSTSDNRNKTLTIEVTHGNTVHNVEISESSTVSDLKKKILSLTGVAICRQQLSGLGGSRAINGAPLGSLNLPPAGTKIKLTAADENMANDGVAERLTATYTIRLYCHPSNYTLNFPGTKTVLEVKTDVYSLTNIPVRFQVWSGWPAVRDLDNTVLAMVGLNLPEHQLTVKCEPPKPSKEYKRIIVDSSDSEQSSVEEFEDASESFTVEDDIFIDPVRTERLQPLMPEGVEDETIGCIEFAERFRQRYGPHCPQFFQGTLEEAIKEACHKPAKDRRLLGVYLHHESSVLTNVFCAQLLGCDSILQTLEANFVVYGWDLTFDSNRTMLLASVSNALGGVAGMTVRNIPVDRLPALIIIMRVRSNTEIYSVINGNVGVSELAGGLVEAVERFGAGRAEDARAEDEREARQKVKQEQDEAYHASLEADRAKDESRKRVQAEKSRQAEVEESERQRVEARNEAIRSEAAARLPPEPTPTEDFITKIRVRLPRGEFLERRFLQQARLQALLDFLTVNGYPSEDFKVISSWPRKDLTNEDKSKTFYDLKLFPQETVLLEER